MQVLVGLTNGIPWVVTQARLIGEISCLYDKRLALPASTGIPHPLADVWFEMRTVVHGDDASVVDHLVENDHVSRSLEQLNIVVVLTRDHWRSRIESQDATLSDVTVLRSGRGTASHHGTGVRSARRVKC